MRTRLKALPNKEYLLSRLHYDSDKGLLFWKYRPREQFSSDRGFNMWNSKYEGKEAGSVRKDGYATVMIDWVAYDIHRIVWKMHTGRDPVKLLDHIDGDRFNNKISNLREADYSQNNTNRKAIYRNKRSVYKGVTVRDSYGVTRYIAVISAGKKKIHLGTFDTELEAHLAYKESATRLHKDFANTGDVEIEGLSFTQAVERMLFYKNEAREEAGQKLEALRALEKAEAQLAKVLEYCANVSASENELGPGEIINLILANP